MKPEHFQLTLRLHEIIEGISILNAFIEITFVSCLFFQSANIPTNKSDPDDLVTFIFQCSYML